MLRVNRSLSDAIACWMREKTSKLDRQLYEGDSLSYEALAELLISFLELNPELSYLISMGEIDRPANKGEYTQVYISDGAEIIEKIRHSRDILFGLVDPSTGRIVSISLDESEDHIGYEIILSLFDAKQTVVDINPFNPK